MGAGFGSPIGCCQHFVASSSLRLSEQPKMHMSFQTNEMHKTYLHIPAKNGARKSDQQETLSVQSRRVLELNQDVCFVDGIDGFESILGVATAVADVSLQ